MRMLLLAGSMPRASNGQTRIPLVATLPWVSEDPKVTHVVRPVLATMHGQGGTRGGTVLSDAVHAPTHPCGCWGNTDGCYLVDPASSHMLVSKIKPCMSRSWTLGWVDRSASGVHRSGRPFCRRCAPGLNWPGRASGAVTLKKLECSKQAYALDTLAWDNTTGF
ncbi:hypothetical protein VNO80_34103 [Phaseolus coccineus]|uniref:Uncharacterized protein n=1 Tax=Phaseolus coccineus TaxID=3886 RepID=A0AAN9KZ00_PHACN